MTNHHINKKVWYYLAICLPRCPSEAQIVVVGLSFNQEYCTNQIFMQCMRTQEHDLHKNCIKICFSIQPSSSAYTVQGHGSAGAYSSCHRYNLSVTTYLSVIGTLSGHPLDNHCPFCDISLAKAIVPTVFAGFVSLK